VRAEEGMEMKAVGNKSAGRCAVCLGRRPQVRDGMCAACVADLGHAVIDVDGALVCVAAGLGIGPVRERSPIQNWP
jgi:hypothetical protein